MASRTNDSLASFFGGLGDPTRDKLAASFYFQRFFNSQQLLDTYNGSWLAKKIINIPAGDMTRAWRDWKADAKQIETIDNEEKRLGYQAKVKRAMVKARLFGGAGIFIGTGDPDLSLPLDPNRIKRNGIRYLTVLSSNELRIAEVEWDGTSPNYGLPKYYTMGTSVLGGSLINIHPSRVIRFVGDENPEPRQFGMPMADAYGWGMPVLQSVYDAMSQTDSAFANIASLLFEANVDVFGLPNLIEQVSNEEYRKLLTDRFLLAATNKAINRSLVRDSAETYERKQVQFASVPELMDKFMLYISGAADIPAVRLFGMSPAGMSATGESDLRNYYDRISSDQATELTPRLKDADDMIIRSALGDRPAEITYQWAPLWQQSEKERAEIGKFDAETVEIIQRTGLIPSEALAEALVNQLTEHSVYPGLDQMVDDLPPIDFDQLDNPEPVEGLPSSPATRQPTQDATPKSLYISRRVMNSKSITAWARKQGFPSTLFENDLHVTIAYSRQPVDWMKVGESWSSEIKVSAGGPRMIEQLDGGAIVLLFACRELQWRHQDVLNAGGTFEHDEYQPHITISYQGDPIDLTKIDPYDGEIVLGPEIFREVNPGWKSTVKEK